MPPDSADVPSEGHTLIGGWREPGAATVRQPGAPADRGIAIRVPPPAEASPQAPRAGQAGQPGRLEPVVMKVDLPVNVSVATFQGKLPAAAPATFGDLLDASLRI